MYRQPGDERGTFERDPFPNRPRPKGNTKAKLADTGAAKVDARVTYKPDGGDPNTKRKRINLKLRD
jgi:hypothetical protein